MINMFFYTLNSSGWVGSLPVNSFLFRVIKLKTEIQKIRRKIFHEDAKMDLIKTFPSSSDSRA